MLQIAVTFVALGCLQACLYKSAEAKWVLLTTMSTDGPISLSSTRGIRAPDFLSWMLGVEVTKKLVSRLHITYEWLNFISWK